MRIGFPTPHHTVRTASRRIFQQAQRGWSTAKSGASLAEQSRIALPRGVLQDRNHAVNHIAGPVGSCGLLALKIPSNKRRNITHGKNEEHDIHGNAVSVQFFRLRASEPVANDPVRQIKARKCDQKRKDSGHSIFPGP
jgi:hypothetical protein